MTYDGGTRWGVRWNKAGHPPSVEEIGSETPARNFHGALSKGYALDGRTDRPELVYARIVWEVAAPTPGATATDTTTNRHDEERNRTMSTSTFRSDATGTVEAHQYDGTQESATTIAEAFGLTLVQQHPPAAVYTVPDSITFSPGDYYDAETREIALPGDAWIWLNRDTAVLGCEWDEYFRNHFTPTEPAEVQTL